MVEAASISLHWATRGAGPPLHELLCQKLPPTLAELEELLEEMERRRPGYRASVEGRLLLRRLTFDAV